MHRPSTRLAARWLLPSLLVVATATGAHADPAPLSNADVVAMVKAKLADGTIVASIKSSASHFDTASADLIKLTQSGVPQPVIQAMIEAQQGGGSAPAAAYAANAMSIE